MAEINEIVSKQAIDDIIKLNAAFGSMNTNLTAVMNSTKQLNDQLNKTASSTATAEEKNKAYEKTIEKTIENQETLTKQQIELQKSQEKLSSLRTDEAQQLANVRKQIQQENELLKLNAVLNDKTAGTLEKATAYNRLLEIEKRKLNLTTKEGVARLKEINSQQDKNNELIASSSNKLQQQKINIGNYASGVKGLSDQLANGEIGLKAFIGGFTKLSRALLTNPIVIIGAAIALLIKGVSDAIKESEERTNAISTAFAQFKPILRTIGDGFEFVADAVIKTVGFLGKAFSAVTEFLGINPKGSSDEFVQAEKTKQQAVSETRKLNEEASKQEAIIAQQREILADKENYSYKQRVEALKTAGAAEQQLANDKARIAELNLKALQQEAALDDNNAAMNDKLSAAIVATNKAKEEAANVGRKLAREQQRLTKENEADLKTASEERKKIEQAKQDAIIKEAERQYNAEILLIKATSQTKEEEEERIFQLKKKYLLDSLSLMEAELNAFKGDAVEKIKLQEKINDTRAKLDESNMEKRISDNEKAGNKILSSDDVLKARAKKKQDEYDDGLIQSTQKVADTKQQQAEQEVERVKWSEDEKTAIIQASTESVIQIQSAIFDFINQGYENDLTLLEQKNQQGLISDKEYAKQRAEIELKQAKANKLQGVFDATINTAKAITSALTVAPPAGAILAIAAGIAGGLQIASILSTPLPTIPAFAKGTESAPSEFIAGERGAELGIMKTGQSLLIDKPTYFKGNQFQGMKIISNPELQSMTQRGEFNYNSDNTAVISKLDSLEKTIANKPVFIFDEVTKDKVGYRQNNHTVYNVSDRYISRLKRLN